MSEHNVDKHLEMIVHYPAVKKPFEEKHASHKETLSALKSAVLQHETLGAARDLAECFAEVLKRRLVVVFWISDCPRSRVYQRCRIRT